MRSVLLMGLARRVAGSAVEARVLGEENVAWLLEQAGQELVQATIDARVALSEEEAGLEQLAAD